MKSISYRYMIDFLISFMEAGLCSHSNDMETAKIILNLRMNSGGKLAGILLRIVLLVKIDIVVVKHCIEIGIAMRVISLFVPMIFIWSIYGRKNRENEKAN